MDDHDSKPDPGKKQGDRRPQSVPNNTLWWLLALAVLLMVLITYLHGEPEYKIPYSDFLTLVEQSGERAREALRIREEQPQADEATFREEFLAKYPEATHEEMTWARAVTGHVDVTVRRGDEEVRARYSQPEDIMISAYRITGTVRRESLQPAPQQGPAINTEPAMVSFVTDRQPYWLEAVETLRRERVPFDSSDPPRWWSSYVPVLVFTILMIFLFVFFIRRMGGAGSPMAFGRSRGKLFAQEDIEILFEDVAGIEEAVDEVREIVDFLRNPEKYQALGGRIPKGVLLVGPPGTGKTLLGKAIAGEAGVPFFSLSGSDFVEMFVGVGAARVRDMFQQAETKAPCIVFIDELDALGKTRGSGSIGGHDEREQTLNALLVEMDGFASNSGIIILGATNRPETLDPALLRPGRFDRHVLVDRPDVAGREDILEVHLREVKVSANVNVKELAAITSGFVGADLANLVNEAALLAARMGKSSVGMQEFNEAVERVTAGLEKKQRIMQDDEKTRVAYHEAGHALVAYCLPNTDPVHKVSIIPRGLAALGYTMQRPEQDRFLMTKSELESRIKVLLAGTVAEEMIFEDISTGAQNDLERCSEIARSMVMDYGMSGLGRVSFRDKSTRPFLTGAGDAVLNSHSEETSRQIDVEVKRILDDAIEDTRHILESRRDALVEISKHLLDQETLDADELRGIVDEHAGPMVVPGTAAEPKPSDSAPETRRRESS